MLERLLAATRRISAWRPLGRRVPKRKIALFFVSLYLFVLSVTLMKAGARTLAPVLQEAAIINNLANGLGFGWLSAYAVMSGSPVAAAGLTFFDAGVLDLRQTFAMLNGSRLGASFIVLLFGFYYVLRGRDRAASLGMGLLSMTVTASTGICGFFIGLFLLRLPRFNVPANLGSGVIFGAVVEDLFNPIVDLLLELLPRWSLFPTGVALIVLSFNLFDRCLPELAVRESRVGHVSEFVYRRWVMFLLGASITLISMSVSVSLGLLVPLSNRGFIRRENVIPYIMGANITTFIDTLFVALLLDNAQAVTLVWVQMLSIGLVSAIVLVGFYRHYETAMLHFTGWVSVSNRNMLGFVLIIVLVPIVLLLL